MTSTQKPQKGKRFNISLLIFVVIVYAAIFFLLRQFFKDNITPFTVELIAAVIGSILILTTTAVMLQFQTRQEKEREFSNSLFRLKLQMYQELLKLIFAADDDNIIEEQEVMAIENQIGMACLVANQRLITQFTQFMCQLKLFGVFYFRTIKNRGEECAKFIDFVNKELQQPIDSNDSAMAYDKRKLYFSRQRPAINMHTVSEYFVSLDEIIQGMRDDLAVVEGDVAQSIEHFISIRYNQHNLIPNPNKVL